jgi:hypothetical protein
MFNLGFNITAMGSVIFMIAFLGLIVFFLSQGKYHSGKGGGGSGCAGGGCGGSSAAGCGGSSGCSGGGGCGGCGG